MWLLITHKPRRINFKSFAFINNCIILILILLVPLSCSKPKYDIVVANYTYAQLFFKFDNKEIFVDTMDVHYLGSFREGTYNWEASIDTANFDGKFYLDQHKTFEMWDGVNEHGIEIFSFNWR